MHDHDEYEYNYDNLVPVWNYEEFTHLPRISEPRTNFARGYLTEGGHFYLEPWFYTQLTRLFERFPGDEKRILTVFFELASSAPFVVFTRDINDPVFVDSNYRYIEINEVIEKAELKFDDISRGSDYGD